MPSKTQIVKATLIINIELEVTEDQPLIIQPGVPNKLTCKPTGNTQMAAGEHAPLLWLFGFHRNEEFMKHLSEAIHQYCSLMYENDPNSKNPIYKSSPLL